MNSHNENPLEPLKAEFTANEEQLHALDRMSKLMKSMRCFKKENKISKNELPFQVGIRLSIASLKMMHKDLERRFGDCPIMSARTNNDSLENFFCVLRYINGFLKGITVLLFWAALRSIILGKDTCSLNNRGNSKDRFTYEGQLTCKILLQLKKPAKTQADISEEYEDVKNLNEDDLDDVKEINSSKMVEEDGLEYFSGYISQKLRKKYPHLGKSEPQSGSSYVSMLSQGNLHIPTLDWLSTAKILEDCFLKFAPRVFEEKKHPILRLVAYGSKCLEQMGLKLDDEILSTFMRCRMYLRIKALNHEAMVTKILRRRANKLARITGDKHFKKKY